ncbi:hypothetical protein Tco_1242919 [Tanacetum coccineum]
MNGKWKTVRPDVVLYCGVYGNAMRRLRESGASDADYYTRVLMDYEAETVEEIRRPMGRDKAKDDAIKNESRASGSSSMNDEALARLMVNDMASQEKEERLAFLEIKMREPYDHLIGDAQLAMEELRVEIMAKYDLQY